VIVFGESVTRVRREVVGEDRYGNPRFSDAVTVVDGAAVADPAFAEPAEVGRSSVVADLVIMWPHRTVDGRDDDAWIVRGVKYESIGPAFPWVNPWTHETAGTVVRLRAVTG
jgi:hypothetical protein